MMVKACLLFVVFVLVPGASAADEFDGFVLVENEEGQLIYASDAQGREREFVYDEEGDPTYVVDENGEVVLDLREGAEE